MFDVISYLWMLSAWSHPILIVIRYYFTTFDTLFYLKIENFWLKKQKNLNFDCKTQTFYNKLSFFAKKCALIILDTLVYLKIENFWPEKQKKN